MIKKLLIAAVFALAGSVAFAQTFVDVTQTTVNYDRTNTRMGINTSTPRAALEVSGSTVTSPTFLIAPSTATPTGVVTGTIAMNSNGKLATLTNTTTGVWTSISTPTTVTFVPAN